jgi:hypothetical protein
MPEMNGAKAVKKWEFVKPTTLANMVVKTPFYRVFIYFLNLEATSKL